MSAPTLGYGVYPASPVTGHRAILDRLADLVHRTMTKHRYRKDLQHMPDWMLRDIGIERGQIGRVVDCHVDAMGHPKGGYPF